MRRSEALARDARAAVELSRLGLAYLPWTASALRPAAMVQLVNEIIINGRRTVVEFGAGISTLYLARVLSGVGGQLMSFEDDADWAQIVRNLLEQNGLAGVAQVIDAPLASCQQALAGLQWHDAEVVTEALAAVSIDMIVVDGPKAFEAGKALARYPALPMLQDRLAPRCAVVLDDAGRAGEQEVLARWQALPGFDLDVEIAHSGLALCRRGGHFHTGM